MKFSKYNNPAKKKHKQTYSKRLKTNRDQLMDLLSKCDDDSTKAMLIKAYDVTINP